MSAHADVRERTELRFVFDVMLVAAFAFAIPKANANVYKCAGENGTLIYQEDPCPKGKELRNFDVDPPSLSILPGIQTSPPPAPPRETAKPPRSASMEHSDKAPGKVIGDATGRRFIRTGMTEAEVLAKIGRPDITAGASKNHHARWSYLPTSDDPDTITTITFNGETVSDVTRKLVKR